MPPCLTLNIIRYGSRVKWTNQGKGVVPPHTHLGVVATEKGAFGPSSIMVTNFTCSLTILGNLCIKIRKRKYIKSEISISTACQCYYWSHHHHHVVPLAQISLTLSRHFSLSFITSGRSSGLHPVSSHSCCMYVWDGRPAFAWPYAGVHRSTSLMSSSLLLQQCPACLVRLAWIVFVMGGRWPYSWCLMGCCCQDLFNIARNILV